MVQEMSIDFEPHWSGATFWLGDLEQVPLLLWGLICEMGVIASHRTTVKISDKVNMQNTCHAAGLGQMVTLTLIIFTI